MQSILSEQPISVFLVDDHKCVLWGLEKLVDGEQPRMRVVGKASSRAEAIAGVRETAPDVVLLDLDLGGAGSLEFLPELLQQSAAQVLILTGTRDPAMLERAIALGARGIVLKNEPAEVLLRAIERVHRGELWVERGLMTRVLGSFTRRREEDPAASRIGSLTPKEHQIVCTIVQQRGAKGEAIAARLFMSEHTLRNHLTAIYRKLDLKNRLDLVMFALEHDLAKASSSKHPSEVHPMH